jgi:hypothetical protein
LENVYSKWWSKKYNNAKESYNDAKNKHLGYTSSVDCEWYDVSCLLQFIFGQYFNGWSGTMEPACDADSYPMGKSMNEDRKAILSKSIDVRIFTSFPVIVSFREFLVVDWREIDAVTGEYLNNGFRSSSHFFSWGYRI